MHETFNAIAAASERSAAAVALTSMVTFAIYLRIRKNDLNSGAACGTAPTPSGRPPGLLPAAFIDELWRPS